MLWNQVFFIKTHLLPNSSLQTQGNQIKPQKKNNESKQKKTLFKDTGK